MYLSPKHVLVVSRHARLPRPCDIPLGSPFFDALLLSLVFFSPFSFSLPFLFDFALGGIHDYLLFVVYFLFFGFPFIFNFSICFFPLPSFATRPPRKTLVYFVALSDNGDMFMAGFYLICLFYSSNKKNIMKMSYLNVIFILSYHIFFS